MPSQLPLDPKLPANFDDTPNSERSKEQLDNGGIILMGSLNQTAHLLTDVLTVERGTAHRCLER